jgi:hypothetical protein
MKHSETEGQGLNWSLRSSLLINVCPFSYKGTTIYRRPLGMNIYPNYTFSVPDKRLYTLYKGITVTPRLLQASNVSSYGQATFPRGASCLCFVRRLFTRLTQPRVAVPPDRAKAAARAAPSAPIQSSRPSSRPPRPHRASEASRLIRLPPCTGAYPTHDASNLSAPSASKVCILRDRRGWETRL